MTQPTTLLLKASTEIQRESAGLFVQETEFKNVLKAILKRHRPKFDFAALQIVHPGERVIETVSGLGQARQWEGLAKHYLEPKKKLGDIQANIFLARPPRAEVVTGNDPRYDEWIFKTYRTEKFVSAFVPLVLAWDGDGKVLKGKDLDDWLGKWRTSKKKDVPWPGKEMRSGGRRQFVQLRFPTTSNWRGEVSWEIIGTVEVGFENCEKNTIQLTQAVALAKSAARIAIRVYHTLFQHVFQTVVDHAVQIGGANYASLHYDRSGDVDPPGHIRYVYEFFSGKVAKDFLKRHPPRRKGLGQNAITKGRALFIPDPSQGHDDLQLKRTNKEVYAEGITAMAAIPLLVKPRRKVQSAPRKESPAGSPQGVLYVGFGEQCGEGLHNVHHFTLEEKGWLRLFANSAADAIRHATAYTQMRDQARLLKNLHSVTERLVGTPEDPELLRHIAGSVLNILGADVVTIYECNEREAHVLARPVIAGRLCKKESMRTAIRAEDTPALLLKKRTDVFADKYYPDKDGILYDPKRLRPPLKGPPFPEREGIRAAAGIPLKYHDEIVGLLFINYRRPHRFSDAEKTIIATVASTAAIAIRNRRLLEIYRARDSEIITSVSETITSVDLDKVLQRIVERAVTMTGAQVGEIRLLNYLRDKLVLQPQSIDTTLGRYKLSSFIREVVSNRVKDQCSPVLIDDFKNDARFSSPPNNAVGSVLAVPLLNEKKRLFGVLVVAHSEPWALQRYQLVLEALANLAVFAIDHDENLKKVLADEKISMLAHLAAHQVHEIPSKGKLIEGWAEELQDARRLVSEDMERISKIKTTATEIMHEVRELTLTWEENERQPVDLRQIIDIALRKIRLPKIEPDLPKVMPVVETYQRQLNFVFVNLLRNAAKAMKGKEKAKLSIGGYGLKDQNKHWMVVWIKDTGKGMTKTELETIGQLPHNAQNDEKDTGGMGVAAFLVRSFIERMGGRIDWDSEVGKWTKVTFGLPAQVPHATDSKEIKQ